MSPAFSPNQAIGVEDRAKMLDPAILRSTATTDRTIAILARIALMGPVSIVELQAGVEMSRAAVWRIVHRLKSRGWVRQRMMDGRIELTSLVSQIFDTAHYCDREFEPIFVMMKEFSDQFDVHADFAAFRAAGLLRIFESSKRTAMEGTSEQIEVSHELYLAALASCNKRQMNLHYSAARKDVPKVFATDLVHDTDDAIRLFAAMEIPIPEVESGAICLPILGAEGSPGAIRLYKKHNSRSMAGMREIAHAFYAALSGSLYEHGQADESLSRLLEFSRRI